jgi:hypothetical protein
MGLERCLTAMKADISIILSLLTLNLVFALKSLGSAIESCLVIEV